MGAKSHAKQLVSQLASQLQTKTPTGCVLGACSGVQPVGYRFSLLTLLLSGGF